MTEVILGLDVGRARIGLARGERGGALAFGRGWLERRGTRADVEAVRALATSEGAALVVVGLPRTTRGTDSKQTALAREFAAALARAGLPVALEDERFTTALAERRLRQVRAPRGRRGKGAVDEASAVLILESYLQRGASQDGTSQGGSDQHGRDRHGRDRHDGNQRGRDRHGTARADGPAGAERPADGPASAERPAGEAGPAPTGSDETEDGER